MDYSKIRVLMMQRNYSVRKLAKEVGMSDAGFSSMMKEQTLRVDVLERLCEIFDVPVSYFFDEGEDKRKPCKECTKCKAQLELLKELLNEKDYEIAKLNQQLGRKSGTEDSAVA